jgi:hypothetical protein
MTNNIDSLYNPRADYIDYLDKLIEINTKSGPEIRGKLIEIVEAFLVLKHKDGRRTRIRYRDINIIAEIGGSGNREDYDGHN